MKHICALQETKLKLVPIKECKKREKNIHTIFELCAASQVLPRRIDAYRLTKSK